MTLEVMVPQGHFGYQPQAERQGRYLAIAAGSGITPMLAIIATTLQTEPESQFTLIYGNRTSQSMMFRQALADLKDKAETLPRKANEDAGLMARGILVNLGEMDIKNLHGPESYKAGLKLNHGRRPMVPLPN